MFVYSSKESSRPMDIRDIRFKDLVLRCPCMFNLTCVFYNFAYGNSNHVLVYWVLESEWVRGCFAVPCILQGTCRELLAVRLVRDWLGFRTFPAFLGSMLSFATNLVIY